MFSGRTPRFLSSSAVSSSRGTESLPSNTVEQILSLLSFKVEDSDFIVLNTCSVREKPQVKILSYLGQIRLLKEKKPDMVVGITGCVAQQEGDKFLKNNKVEAVIISKDEYENMKEAETYKNEQSSFIKKYGNRKISFVPR